MSIQPCSACQLSLSLCSCSFPAASGLSGHTLTPNQRESPQGKERCEECGAEARLFCLCGAPFRKICAECDLAHYQKAPFSTHSKHPISVYTDLITSKADFDAFLKKQLYINDLQSAFSQEMYRFDAFTQAVKQEFDLIIGKIVTKRDEIMQELRFVYRPRLEASLAAVQQTIERKRYVESLEIETFLDELLRNGYKSGLKFELNLFSGLVNMPKVEEIAQKSVICDIFPNPKLAYREIPVVKDNFLRLFNPKTLKMRELLLSQHTKIDKYSFYCYISDFTLLCCGGTWRKDVYEVNICTGSVVKGADMNYPRGVAGIWNYQGKWVYVYGGENMAYSRKAEKYDLSGKIWANLRNLMETAKFCCSVCEHSAGIYLSGCERAGISVEFFNPTTETFKLVLTDTPRFVPILFCLDEELFLITQNTIKVANLASSKDVKFTAKANFTALGIPFYGCFSPMQFFQGELIGAISSCGEPCGLFSFRPGKLQFTQVLTLSY